MAETSGIAAEITRIQANIDNALAAIKEKGVAVAADATSDNLAAYIGLIKAITFTNLVPTSVDTDGSVYNGCGYKDDVRLSSSGGVSGSAQTGSVTTGFMPFKNTDVIRMKGAEWVGATTKYGGHFYINLYDSGRAFLDGIASSTYSGDAGARAQLSATYDEATGITTFSIIDPDSATGGFRAAAKKASFFRINGHGSGANLIVTVNEEIAN